MLDLLAQRYGTRPSAILHVADEWAAYQLDVSAMYVGLKEDARRANRSGANATDAGPRWETAGYQDPSPLVTQKIRLSDYPNGLW